MASPKEKGVRGAGATEEERYLGGFTSGQLKPMGRGISRRMGGCGLYATSRRIIVVETKKGYFDALFALGGIIPVVVAAAGRRDDMSAKAIAELEEKKEFEVRKDDISEIEVTKPLAGWIKTRIGRLNIALNSGERIEFIIGTEKEFENTRDLMSVFYPGRLKVNE
jgi:hypothetical protein